MSDDQSDLFQAAESGDEERVRHILGAAPHLVSVTNAEGATQLHLAALAGHRRVVQLLVEHGGNVNARDAQFDATVAGWAIEYLRGMNGLLATEIEDMLFAIREGDVRWVKRFLARGPAVRQ